MSSKMTVGNFLSQAESRLSARGGFNAIYDCDDSIVRLMRKSADGMECEISRADVPPAQAGEDAATALLDVHAHLADPAELAFARDIYFPVSFVCKPTHPHPR